MRWDSLKQFQQQVQKGLIFNHVKIVTFRYLSKRTINDWKKSSKWSLSLISHPPCMYFSVMLLFSSDSSRQQSPHCGSLMLCLWRSYCRDCDNGHRIKQFQGAGNVFEKTRWHSLSDDPFLSDQHTAAKSDVWQTRAFYRYFTHGKGLGTVSRKWYIVCKFSSHVSQSVITPYSL